MRRFFFWRSSRQAQIATTQPATPPRFEWRGGRRYLAGAPYALPKDPQEVRRLDFQHFFIRQEMRGNYLAPLTQPKSILDVGCGTGRWAMEMAAEYPEANVVGIDLVAPDSAASLGHGLTQQPENVAFLEGDILKGLPFADGSFDFVYIRLMYLAVPARAWPSLLDEVVRVTRPQGWIESVETWAVMSKAFPASFTFTQWVNELLRQRGLDPMIARKMPDLMRSRGLEHVTTHELAHKPPQSQRWKQNYLTISLSMVENIKTSIIAQGIVSPEQCERVIAGVRREVESGQTPMWPSYVTYGQRPANIHFGSLSPHST